MTSGSTKLFIPGPAGKLQGLWRSGGHPQDFRRAAVICHPHPLYGGTMENKVVARTARYVSEAGIEAIRFNFRGIGQSDGSFDKGQGERDDLRAALEYVRSVSSQANLAAVGFSFGAWIALSVGETDPAVKALVGIAPPVRMFDFEFLSSSSKAKLIIYAENDQYTDAATTKAWIGRAKQPLESILIPEVDHFFGARVDDVGKKIAEFLSRVL
jgi:alpha/beta superfamily hydrolase